MTREPLNQQDADHEAATLQKMELDHSRKSGSELAALFWQMAQDINETYRRNIEAQDALRAIDEADAKVERGAEANPYTHEEAEARRREATE